ncbi:universal stress protein [Devosia sp. 2618]|uniref:universal stress protein n=1 Tax=Devosia sp. 2618 TaxID=3156454 RepID=UPI00339612D0
MTYKTILVASDGSELAKRAVVQAGAIAKALGASLSVVTVSSPPPTFAAAEIGWSVPPNVFDQIHAANDAAASKIFAQAKVASGIAISKSVHFQNASPADGIIETAKQLGADLIVMGSHGHSGLNRLLLGSQATKVLAHSTVPVLIVK